VGGRLAQHLTDAGADVIGFDPDADARARIADISPSVRLVDSLEEVLAVEDPIAEASREQIEVVA
jgi:nucleoside-diphosphate-sugar epimerase